MHPRLSVSLALAGILVLIGSPAAQATHRGTNVNAGLIRCAGVTQPGVLANCGTDPLGSGVTRIHMSGRVMVNLAGAEPGVTYDVVYRSLDGATELAIGQVVTNNGGTGRLKVNDFFAVGDIGAGVLVLTRDGADQFVTGFQVDTEEAELSAGLVRCEEVTQPALLTGCGTDPLLHGHAGIEDDGDVEVNVVRAEPGATYEVVFRSLDGTELTIGTLTTNVRGSGSVEVDEFFASGDAGAGNIVLRRDGLDQFVTGFKVAR